MTLRGVCGSIDLKIFDLYKLNDNSIQIVDFFSFREKDIILATQIREYKSKLGNVYYRKIYLKGYSGFLLILSDKPEDLMLNI